MPLTRREFLRAGSLAVLAACSNPGPRTATSPTASPTTPTPSPTPTALPVWRRIEASGPSARQDHSFSGEPSTGVAVLFGGRDADFTPLADAWILTGGRWERVSSSGPAARFGHAAAVISGNLVVFGGQGGPTTFFNDTWSLDLSSRTWTRVRAGGTLPAKRYGTGSAVVGDALLFSHGFTTSGRFDDTWTLAGERWQNVSPATGPRPVKRCLHRTASLPGSNVVALFGGQTNTVPFLGDLWLYDTAARRWSESKLDAAPAARNLHAQFVLGDRLWIFGGRGADGPLADLANVVPGQPAWNNLDPPAGDVPQARSGIEAAVVGQKRALIFGGRGTDGTLADLWEFNEPA